MIQEATTTARRNQWGPLHDGICHGASTTSGNKPATLPGKATNAGIRGRTPARRGRRHAVRRRPAPPGPASPPARPPAASAVRRRHLHAVVVDPSSPDHVWSAGTAPPQRPPAGRSWTQVAWLDDADPRAGRSTPTIRAATTSAATPGFGVSTDGGSQLHHVQPAAARHRRARPGSRPGQQAAGRRRGRRWPARQRRPGRHLDGGQPDRAGHETDPGRPPKGPADAVPVHAGPAALPRRGRSGRRGRPHRAGRRGAARRAGGDVPQPPRRSAWQSTSTG
jgi:hypothetical protein